MVKIQYTLIFVSLNISNRSFDGNALLITSTDGYCSIALFDENELGEEYIGLPSPSSCSEHSTFPKDPLKVLTDIPNSMTNISSQFVKFQSTDKDDVSSHNIEEPPSTSTSAKEKKKRIAPTPVQSFDSK